LVAALVILGDLQAALIVAVFVGLSFAHLLRSDRRPAFFDVLFALAALVGALGFVFGLFDEIVPYDELTHAFTTFSVSLTFYFLFYDIRNSVPQYRGEHRPLRDGPISQERQRGKALIVGYYAPGSRC